jgi:hypothetical protein
MSNRTFRISIENLASTDVLHALMVFGVIFPQFLSATYDRAMRIQTNNGTIWVNLNDSNAKKIVLMIVLVSIAINLTSALIENFSSQRDSFAPIRVIATLSVIYLLLNYRLTASGWELHQVFSALVFWLYFIISDFRIISVWIESYLKYLIVTTFAVNIFFSLAYPSRGTFQCRSDKCGIFGNLWGGFFPHENAFAFFILAAMTLKFIFRTKRSQNIFLGSCVILLLATGSRMALLGALILIICSLAKDTLLSILPVFFALVGVAIFLNNTNPELLTGRGLIWLRIKSQLDSTSWLYGQGMNSFQTGKSKTLFGFALYDEQGTIASQFNRYGIIGVLLFVSFLIAFFICRHEISRNGKIMLVVLTFAMITESFAMPSVSNFYCFLYFLALCAPDLGKTVVEEKSVQVYR